MHHVDRQVLEIHAVEADCWSMYFRLLNHKKLPTCHQRSLRILALGQDPGISNAVVGRVSLLDFEDLFYSSHLRSP